MRFSRCYLEITNRCNLACSFCPKTKRPARTLTAEEFRLLAGKLRAYTDYLYLHVIGGAAAAPAVASASGDRPCARLSRRADDQRHASARAAGAASRRARAL